jgi:hypothetical protein
VSANGTADVKKIALEKYHQKVKKTEPKEFGLFDFLFEEEEENSQESEQDISFDAPSMSHQSFTFSNPFAYTTSNYWANFSLKKFISLKNPIYLSYRKLRL